MVSILPVRGMPEILPGDDLARLIVEAFHAQAMSLEDGDVVVVTQKVVSKAEGRLVDPQTVIPSARALDLAVGMGRRPEDVEIVLRETARIVRATDRALIVQTRHGFVCANAGVDHSNVGGGQALLLPEDPDGSADAIRTALTEAFGVDVAVIISDTFGRPWRLGQTNVAIGVSGMRPFCDYRGLPDTSGREMRVTEIATADELAAAAELVQNKVDRVPVALVRGYAYPRGAGRATELVRPADKDLFR